MPLQPDLPVMRSAPHNCAFVTDGSCFPCYYCGGAFAVVCLDALTWVAYPVSIPCHLDHSYAAEVYTSWVFCCARHTLLALGTAACATARSLREVGSFADSRSYIQALSTRRPDELDEGLVDLVLSDCIKLARHFPPPEQHLSSHQQGTFLDSVVDDVDKAAKAQALRQPRPVLVGYIAGVQDTQPALTRDGVQWHNASTLQYCQLRRLCARQQDVLCAPEVASFAYYATCVAFGSLSWGDHLRMVTFRHDLGTAIVTRCALCDAVLTAAHFQGRLPLQPTVVCCTVHADGFGLASHYTGMVGLVTHIVGCASSVGRDVSRPYHGEGCRLPRASRVSGKPVPHRSGASCVEKADGPRLNK